MQIRRLNYEMEIVSVFVTVAGFAFSFLNTIRWNDFDFRRDIDSTVEMRG